MKQRGKRILLISFVFLMALATLATIVSALQQEPILGISRKIDLKRPSLSPDNARAAIDRGNIYDRNFNELAVNVPATAVYVRPLKLRDPRTAAKKLAAILSLDADKIASHLKVETGFIRLAGEITPQTAEKISALKMEGVFLAEETRRLYPHDRTGAHVLGFANSEQGLDGIEYFYDTILQSNPSQASLQALSELGVPKQGIGDQGVHLVLTLDLRVQELLERCLAAVIKKSAAVSGSAALISPASGALVALANQPTFDPNRFWTYSNKDLRNRFISDPIMPGGLDSFFKQAAEFEEIKALTREITRTAPTDPLPPNSLLLVPSRGKRPVTDQDTVADNEILADLFNRLHSQASVSMDLPSLILGDSDNSRSDKTVAATGSTGLQLLADFCFLLSGGRRISPHLLNSVWDRASNQMLSAAAAARLTPEQPPVSEQAVLPVLQRLGKKGPANGFFLESVMPRHGSDSLRETLAATTGDQGGTGRVNYQMLGLLSRDGQSLALIIALNDAELTMLMNTAGRNSLPMTVLDRHLDRRAVQWALAPAVEPTPAKLHRARYLLPAKLKRRTRESAAVTGTANGHRKEMPQVTGRSLRVGLQALQQYDLRISVIGSGLIVAQQPCPGAAVRKGGQCMLTLATNR